MTEKSGNTPMRGIRISDKLWDEAKRVADENEETVSAVVVRALRKYVQSAK